MAYDFTDFWGTPGMAPWYSKWTGFIAAVQDALNAQSTAGPQKNLLDNGGMKLWQRATTYTGTGDGARTVDRWQVINTGAVSATASLSVKQDAGDYGMVDALNLTVGGAITGFHVAQSLEEHVLDWTSGKTVRLSFLAKADVPIVLDDVRIGQRLAYPADAGDMDHDLGDFSLSTAWRRYTSTVTLSAAGTTRGSLPYLCLIIGTALAAKTWTNVKISNISLSIGPLDGDFMEDPPAVNFARCARVYQQNEHSDYYSPIRWNGQAYDPNVYSAAVIYPTVMQHDPSVTISHVDSSNFNTGSDAISGASRAGFLMSFTANAAGSGSYWEATYTADAEITVSL